MNNKFVHFVYKKKSILAVTNISLLMLLLIAFSFFANSSALAQDRANGNAGINVSANVQADMRLKNPENNLGKPNMPRPNLGERLQKVEDRMDQKEMRMDIRASSTEIRREDRASSSQKRMDDRFQKRCDEIGDRIDNRVSVYAKNHDTHVAAYKANRDRLENLISKLEAEGKNVTTLKADLTVLDQKIQAFADLRAAYILKLQSVKMIPCDQKFDSASSTVEIKLELTGNYVNALEIARAEQEKVFDAAKDIAQYIRNTIVKDVKALNLTADVNVKVNASVNASN